MKKEIYKLIVVNNDNTVDIDIDDNRALMKDFEAAVRACEFKYAFEVHSSNPYNNNIFVEGYYFEGLYLPNGYPLKHHYQYHIYNK